MRLLLFLFLASALMLVVMGQVGWESRNEVQGDYFSAGAWDFPNPGESGAARWYRTFYFPDHDFGPDAIPNYTSIWDSTSADEAAPVRWFTFTSTTQCSLRIYTRDACADSLDILNSTVPTFSSTLTTSLFQSGVDSVRVAFDSLAAGTKSIVLWGMR
jgi:hypothetical protein